jgi:hypothetical protein
MMEAEEFYEAKSRKRQSESETHRNNHEQIK